MNTKHFGGGLLPCLQVKCYNCFVVQQDDLVMPCCIENACITVSGVMVHFFLTFSYCDAQLFVNSSRPSAAYMRQWIGSAFMQIMACRLFGAKPLFKPMLSCPLNFNRNTKLNSSLVWGYDFVYTIFESIYGIDILITSWKFPSGQCQRTRLVVNQCWFR